ncbi:MAG TPA: response regulator transcription factor [Myxococcales bacterium]|jgi:two-component system response regulator NreC|nr:response regulator transcription factor [Myxococcales bacterium]
MVLKVAVIDDHPVYRAGLRAVLSTQGDLLVVAEAADAQAGYAMLEEAQPDLVLLDVVLPGADGITAAREILRREPNRRLLMISMRVEEHTVADALAAGALGYAGKDQPLEELLEALRTVAQGRTYLPPHVSAEGVERRLRRGREGPLGALSRREREVFALLVQGHTNEKVAQQLGISRRTVETHRSRILRKLRVHSAAELIHLAARHGLLGT